MKYRAEEAPYYFAEPVRRAFEALRQPMAVCQAVDEKTRALLASDSLVRLVGRTQFLSGGHVSLKGAGSGIDSRKEHRKERRAPLLLV